MSLEASQRACVSPNQSLVQPSRARGGRRTGRQSTTGSSSQPSSSASSHEAKKKARPLGQCAGMSHEPCADACQVRGCSLEDLAPGQAGPSRVRREPLGISHVDDEPALRDWCKSGAGLLMPRFGHEPHSRSPSDACLVWASVRECPLKKWPWIGRSGDEFAVVCQSLAATRASCGRSGPSDKEA
jgi:hypothetical protein